jgi:hypothetical protein
MNGFSDDDGDGVVEQNVLRKIERPYNPPARTTVPEDWVPTRHPFVGSRQEIAVFLGRSLAYVDRKIARRCYRTKVDGDLVFVFVDSVFADLASLPDAKSRSPRPHDAPKRKPGRPRRVIAPDPDEAA